jgi:hypothetical protein
MTRVAACPEDRQRLLDNGEMATQTYSQAELDDIARYTFRVMTSSAELMGLALSEPVMEAGPVDGFGGRLVTVR